MLTTDNSGNSITLPYDSSNGPITSSDVPADSYYGFSDGLHTVSVTVNGSNGFTGRIALEGTLATTPTADDWFTIPLNGVSAISFSASSGTTAYTFTGNYVYIRALIRSDNSGTLSGLVNSILLNR